MKTVRADFRALIPVRSIMVLSPLSLVCSKRLDTVWEVLRGRVGGMINEMHSGYKVVWGPLTSGLWKICGYGCTSNGGTMGFAERRIFLGER